MRYIRDPFGNCYGYSTMGLAQAKPSKEKTQKTPASSGPYNTEAFNLWSTNGETKLKNAATWVKNWGE